MIILVFFVLADIERFQSETNETVNAKYSVFTKTPEFSMKSNVLMIHIILDLFAQSMNIKMML